MIGGEDWVIIGGGVGVDYGEYGFWCDLVA